MKRLSCTLVTITGGYDHSRMDLGGDIKHSSNLGENILCGNLDKGRRQSERLIGKQSVYNGSEWAAG